MAIVEPIFTQTEREKRTKKEMSKLNKIFSRLPDDSRKVLDNLIKQAAFMAVTLEETRQIIARDGIIDEYKNGAEQWGVKKSAAVEVYDKMINTYSKIIKQLCEALPDGAGSDPAEELLAFTMGARR